MTETQKRIQELKTAIPHVKEKVVAVASLFAISVAMMASATYAWVTLSRNPELGGVHTTVSANGNLEIALSDFDGKAPDPSGINDSFSAQNQTPHGANTSWGNLINLSGGYGLENLVLRPATLNTQSATLLSGVKYGEDGRVEGTATDFGFTTWAVKDTTLNTMGFIVPDAANETYKDGMYGVRAISSVGFPQGKGALQQKLDNADALYQESVNGYDTIMNNKTYISALENIVSKYLNTYLSDDAVTFDKDEVAKLYNIFNDFYTNAVCKYGDALAYMANIQQEFKTANYDPYDRDKLYQATSAELTQNNVNLGNSLAMYKNLVSKTGSDVATLKQYRDETQASNGTVTWDQLEPIVDNLISIGTVTVDGQTAGQILASAGGISGLYSKFQELKSKEPVPIVIHNGTLRSFEWLSGCRMGGSSGVSVTAKVLVLSIKGTLRTNLTDNDSAKYYMDRKATENMSGAAVNKGPMVAQDTYGMVLDLWFRTNNPGTDGVPSILALDGLPMLTTTQKQREVVLVGETESRLVYVYNRPTENEIEGIRLTEEVLVYKGEDGDYYNVSSMGKVYIAEVQTVAGTDDEGNEVSRDVVVDTDTPVADGDVSPKMDSITTVDGFSSSNRVWKEGELALNAGEISATQGSGSCYVFYADTPEAAASAKELLRHMRLAFMDANGYLLAEGKMDVDHTFSQSGKYTVPLVIENSSFSAVNAKGEKVFGVSTLEQNVATRISVVVYLDGKELENQMVMSNESIRGSLNLQFTTTEDLRSMKDSALSMQAISLRTSIERTDFEYTGRAHTPKLTATVEGLTPNTVQAVFQRRINTSQGSQITPITLNLVAGDMWEGNCSFTKPGTYVLSSLLVDGVEYALPQDQWITVTVTGFVVGSVSFCDTADQQNLALSASNSVSRDVAVTFTADLAMQPSTVGVRFEYKESADATEVKYFSTDLTRDDAGAWRGVMDFTASGVYTLKYLVLDGDYHELNPSMQKEFTAYLGLRTRVYLQREEGLSFFYTPGETETVTIQAEIITDNDAALMGRENVVLKYGKRGSSLVENGLSADLTWDGKYYSGTFEVNKMGVFQFAYLQAGNDMLTNAVSAPTISSLPKDPPSLLGSNITTSNMGQSAGTTTMFLQGNSDGYYMVRLKEASGIESIEVIFKDPLNNTISQKLEGDALEAHFKDAGEETYVYVPIPAMASGTRNGVWEVTDVRLGGVYSEGRYYGANRDTAGWAGESYSVADDSLPYSFTVYDKFEVKPAAPVTVGKDDADKVVAEFMSAQSITGYEGATIGLKPQGQQLNLPEGLEIDNVILTLTHKNGTSSTYGGYTINVNSNAHPNGMQKFVMEKNANGKWVVDHALTGNMGADNVWGTADDTWTDQNTAANLYLAGEYTYTISYQIVGAGFNSVTYTETEACTGTFKVYSKAPTVTISSVNPAPGTTKRYYTSATPNSTNQVIEGDFSYISVDGFDATVYIYFNYDDSLRDGAIIVPVMPQVTFALSGVPSSGVSGGKMMFGSRAVNFTGISGSGTFGSGTSGSYGSGLNSFTITSYPTMTPDGVLASNQMDIVYNGVTYKTTLSHTVTINNQVCPPYANFTINDSNFTGTTPGRVYSTNGETIVLPDIDNWTINNVATALSTKTYPNPTTSAAGTYNYRYGSFWNYKYKTYARTMYTQSCTVSSKIENITYRLQWRVGGTLYEPGTEIPISGAVNITGVVTEVSREYVSTENITYTKTWYTYTQTGTSNTGTRISFEPNTSVKYDASNNVYDESEVVS